MEHGLTKDKQHRMTIDSLKGIAILGVIMVHSGGAQLPGLLGKIGNAGKHGVQLFLVISGYLAYFSYDQYLQKNSSIQKGDLHWIGRKILRLLPLYYIAVILYYLKGGSAYWYGTEGKVTLLNLVSHLLMIHGFWPHYTDSILGVEWYLCVLAAFYLLVPLLYKLINSLEKAVGCFLFISPVTYVICKGCTKFFVPITDDYIYFAYFEMFWLPAQLPVLLLGVIFFYLSKEQILNKIKAPKIASAIVLLTAFCLMGGMILGYNQILGFSTMTIWGIISFLLILSQYLCRWCMFSNAFWSFIGKNSYPIYLFHYLVIAGMEGLVWRLPFANVLVNWLIQYLCIVVVTIMIGNLLRIYVEEPMLKHQ